MNNTKTGAVKIIITDSGTCTECTADGTTLTVVECGGCPAEGIISAEALMAGSAQDMADAILADWLVGYEGGEAAAAANDLVVGVESADGDEMGVACAW
jgi:hypothetical protein